MLTPDFRALFEAVPSLYLVLLPDAPRYTIVGVSDAYLKATMTERPKILGQALFEVFPDNPGDSTATGTHNLLASLGHVLRDRAPDTMAVQKYDIRRPESEGGGFEERYWSPVNSPVLAGDGGVSYIIHRVEDVTEFVRLRRTEVEKNLANEALRNRALKMETEIFLRAQQLQAANCQLRAANEQLAASERELRDAASFRELLIGIVSHDLSSPLAAIAMSGEILTRKQELDDTGQAIVDRIRRSASRMGNMIAQLLDFTRSHVGGGLPLAPKPTDLADVCRRVVDEVELAYSMPGRFVCEFHGNLNGTWDADRLAQVISNLSANAIKHGESETLILLSARDEGEAVLLEMSNQGEPIPSELAPFIFDPFRRARQNEPSQSGGLGLGLYISRQIVSAHGGSIALRSTAEGTTFSVRLPRASGGSQ